MKYFVSKIIINFLFVFSLFLYCHPSFSQIIFEEAYFINNSNEKIDCLIKNMDWLNNPLDFEYKIGIDGQVLRGEIESVKEFGIVNQSRYVRFSGKADLNLYEVSKLNYNKEPVLEDELIFLKELTQGEATLFEYRDNYLWTFFMQTSVLPAEQLLFKSYKNSDDQILLNNRYKTQFYNALKCKSIDLEMIKKLVYEKNILIDFIKEYNSCRDSYNEIIENQKDLFCLSIRPGISFGELKYNNSILTSRDIVFSAKGSFRIGAELEFIQSFKKGKWSYLIEPTYQVIGLRRVSSGSNQITGHDHSLRLPFGLRYYTQLSDKSKAFINASYVFDINLTSLNALQDIVPNRSVVLGIGLKFVDKFALEFRGTLPKLSVRNVFSLNSSFRHFSLIIGYKLF